MNEEEMSLENTKKLGPTPQVKNWKLILSSILSFTYVCNLIYIYIYIFIYLFIYFL